MLYLHRVGNQQHVALAGIYGGGGLGCGADVAVPELSTQLGWWAVESLDGVWLVGSREFGWWVVES